MGGASDVDSPMSLSWDMSALLEAAVHAEAVFCAAHDLHDADSSTFGHSVVPPQLRLLEDDDQRTVAVAYTPHTVSVQLLTVRNKQQSTSPPHLAGQLLPPDLSQEDIDDIIVDETITAVDLVVRKTEQTAASELVVLVGTSRAHVYSLLVHFEANQVVVPVHEHEDSPLFETLPWSSEMETRYSTYNNGMPRGGVTSIRRDTQNQIVWLTYTDGTMVKLPPLAVFPSIWHQGSQKGLSVEALLLRQQQKEDCAGEQQLASTTVRRYQVNLPPPPPQQQQQEEQAAADHVIVPLQHYRSPLDCVASILSSNPLPQNGKPSADDADHVSALVYGPDLPTLAVYTSERPLENLHQGISGGGAGVGSSVMLVSNSAVLRGVVGGGKAIRGVVGSAMGALRWGLGGGGGGTLDAEAPVVNQSSEEVDGNEDEDQEMDLHPDEPATPFPSLFRRPPLDLLAGHEFHDEPRRVETCTPSPNQELVALSDSLGRIWLVDQASKHVVRMWKGFRQAQCAWIYNSNIDSKGESAGFPALCVVIHSHQRRVVEVWPARGGGRLFAMQVGKDAVLLPCQTNNSSRTSCFLLHSNVVGSTGNRLELLSLEDEAMGHAAVSTPNAPNVQSPATAKAGGDRVNTPSESSVRRSRRTPPGSATRTAALKLRHLQQLLTTDSVQYTEQDVQKAMQDIESLADLATALDLVGTTTNLEDKIGANGADFQQVALEHCRETLRAAVAKNQNTGNTINPNVALLERKIAFYSQLLEAFDALRKFETAPHDVLNEVRDNAASSWAIEAEGWATTMVQILGPDEVAPPGGVRPLEKAKFANFASSVVFPAASKDETKSKKIKIYFNDSTRTRQEILMQVFKPLMADVFSFRVVNSIFEALGVRDDIEYVMKCFGEWFMTLDIGRIAEQALFASRPPVTRLLQELATAQLNKEKGKTALPVLYNFCESSTDLIRAFMLGVLCRDAVLKSSSRKERATYGKVMSAHIVGEWEKLLRKVRVCLLVTLRLSGTRLGAAPLSIKNVEDEGVFSPYEWIARDQLMMTHNNDEITSLEKICKLSNFSFDPFSREGDEQTHFTMLQNSCISAAISEEERAEYLVDFDDDSGALLLFLKHYNEPILLVAHRALLLGAKWSKDPLHLAVLSETVAALRALGTQSENVSLAFSVRLEIWTSHVCPYYKAHLFGFGDVHEISEERTASLLSNPTWLNSFGRLALQILMMLAELPWEEEWMTKFEPNLSNDEAQTWPPIRPDYLLSSLVNKCRRIDVSAWNAHCVTMCGLLVSEDVASLVECVPGLYELFTPSSLFAAIASSTSLSTKQTTFLRNSVINFAFTYNGRAVDSFACLAEIEMLAKIWKFDIYLLRSIFLQAMYELGKDRVVDELMTRSAADIDALFFVQGGVDVVCRRLNHFLSSSRMRSGEMRGVIGLLDAGMCEWIKSRTASSMPIIEASNAEIPIGSTHLLSMRLLSLGASSHEVTQELRLKIHALVVLSGTLVKTVEGRR